jgi:trans-aconitate 2-methyltransferase
MVDWNSKQYLMYGNERTQPAIDLANRIPLGHPLKIADIGCGPGNSTHVLQMRYPTASIIGIDHSPDMISAAKNTHPTLKFEIYDASWDLSWLGQDFDIVFSNACIQWIPNHPLLLKNMMSLLKTGGVLAVQVPMNDHEPAQRIIKTVGTGRMKQNLSQDIPVHGCLSPQEYYDILSEISSDFSIWETTYHHPLKDHAAIIDWYRSTAMRPFLSALTEAEKTEFEQDVFLELKKAYPVEKNGRILFKFRRFFFIAIL